MTAKRAASTRAKSSPNDFHLSSVAALQNASVPFLIGGAFVVEVYAGVSRRTKDFDLYIRPRHVDAALDALARAGYETEVTSPHWLAKAKRGRDYVDLIFRAGNGLCEVDDSWFERAHDHELLGLRVKLAAPEETIWMKAYIMERERFDGADVAHILSSAQRNLIRNIWSSASVLIGVCCSATSSCSATFTRASKDEFPWPPWTT
jgi:predicted nucleotidyltransferase